MLPENNEPPVFDVLNAKGKAPLMIACDHGGNGLPEASSGLVSSPELLELHIAYDIGVRQVARLLSEMLDAAALIANYSRLLVDLNRYPGDPGQMPVVSDGHRISGNENLDQHQIDSRLETYFHPYHQYHGAMVDRLKTAFCRPVILSIHSFTPVMQAAHRPWHLGVLWDQDHTLAENLIAAFENSRCEEKRPLVIGSNQPYHASDPQGYAITEHAALKDVEMALVEIRQDLILDTSGQAWAANVIYDAVAPLLDHRARYDPDEIDMELIWN